MRTAIITGVCGQDGSYLVDLLNEKGYEIHGISNPLRYQEIPQYGDYRKVIFHPVDIGNPEEVFEIIKKIRPDEIYHLASDVETRILPGKELAVFNNNFVPGVNILDAVLSYSPETRVYVAGSCLMFGNVVESTQNELTPMHPNTPYGIAKTALYNYLVMYREVHGLFCVCGILFNHESPRRSPRFLPKKITEAVAKIKMGLQTSLELGDIEIQRDWSYAGDIARSMWLMLQSKTPHDYVVGSGELRSAKELLEVAFTHVGLDWREYVSINENFIRKVEYTSLCADPKLITSDLGWSTTIDFRTLICSMVDSDLRK